MADFNKCIYKVLEFEGGYSNDPYDSGGVTYKGVTEKLSRKYYNKMPYELTQFEILEIYRYEFWNPIQGDRIKSNYLALCLLDFAVNAGARKAIMYVQKLLGISVDGILGPITLKHLNNIKNVCVFTTHYNFERVKYYIRLNNKHFINGWINRVRNLEKIKCKI